jgi:superoxide reductase
VNGNVVDVVVGSVSHPMEENHYIEWIIVETNLNTYIRKLTPGVEPKASFALTNGESVVSVYEYCNLHGFWKSE